MGNVRHQILHEQLSFQKPTLLNFSIFIHCWFSMSISERRHVVRRMLSSERKILFESLQANAEFILFFKSWPSSIITKSILQKVGTITISSLASEEQFLCLISFGLGLTWSDALGFQEHITYNSEVLGSLHTIFHLVVELWEVIYFFRPTFFGAGIDA